MKAIFNGTTNYAKSKSIAAFCSRGMDILVGAKILNRCHQTRCIDSKCTRNAFAAAGERPAPHWVSSQRYPRHQLGLGAASRQEGEGSGKGGWGGEGM